MESIKRKVKILVVDDDPMQLEFLTAVLSLEENYEIRQAKDASLGLRFAREIQPDIIVSDYYMPEIDGFEFCQQIKGDEELNSAIFILLTSETGINYKVDGLTIGADDYIEKPVDRKFFLSKVKAFVRIKTLQDELKEEREKLAIANKRLEKSFEDLLKLLLDVLEIRVPGASARAQVAKSISDSIADKMALDVQEKRTFGYASLLHEVGKIGLPDEILEKNYVDMNTEEREKYNQYPIIGERLVYSIKDLEEASVIISRCLENYDGSGVPWKLRENEILLGGRILRAIVFQEELFKAGFSAERVMEETRNVMHKYLDPSVAKLLLDFIRESDSNFFLDKQMLFVHQLKPGMAIAEDIYTSKGVKLLPEGTVLTERSIERLHDYTRTDPVIGWIYVLRNKEPDTEK